jgi:hypothetical protein
MQNVVFVDSNNQPIASYSMDAPRIGELVGINGQGFSVNSVRYYLYANGAVRVAVVLAPLPAPQALLQHYEDLRV